MNAFAALPSQAVLDSISDGVYVTNISRQIIYWGKSAERITGWPASEILGKHCYDDVLCHIDKDGHRLCGEEYCPLHRSIVTGQASTVPFVVFAQRSCGGRVPLQVSVAPVRNSDGKIIGGVETFRDLSHEFRDIERAKTIQSLSLQQELPKDPRVRFSALYTPHDVIGGDFYAVAALDSDRYGFFLADITGHGVPAALYTMYLSSLWESTHHLIHEPIEFIRSMNSQLCHLIHEDEPFAAGLCGMLDLKDGLLRIAGAGNPDPLLVRADNQWQRLNASGLPLGIMSDSDYEENVVPINSGDSVLLYSDGAIEVAQSDGSLLGVAGLEQLLKEIRYPNTGVDLRAIEQELLTRSNLIRFDDDLTLLEIRMT